MIVVTNAASYKYFERYVLHNLLASLFFVHSAAGLWWFDSLLLVRIRSEHTRVSVWLLRQMTVASRWVCAVGIPVANVLNTGETHGGLR